MMIVLAPDRNGDARMNVILAFVFIANMLTTSPGLM